MTKRPRELGPQRASHLANVPSYKTDPSTQHTQHTTNAQAWSPIARPTKCASWRWRSVPRFLIGLKRIIRRWLRKGPRAVPDPTQFDSPLKRD
jgi:hypothetical protein